MSTESTAEVMLDTTTGDAPEVALKTISDLAKIKPEHRSIVIGLMEEFMEGFDPGNAFEGLDNLRDDFLTEHGLKVPAHFMS